MATTDSSPLLNALERAYTLSLEDAMKDALVVSTPAYAEYERGEIPPSEPVSEADKTIAYLDDVATQIAQVQDWLRSHPELLHVLDLGIHDEVHKMERRMTLVGVAINAFFTFIGVILGLVLPALVTWMIMR